jgi:hypothetical protein
MKVYVHRRPVAQFTMSPLNPLVGQRIIYQDSSYDPDLQFTDPEGKRGIRNWQWQCRIEGGEWANSSAPPEYIYRPGTVEVRLRVQDFLGAWSDWFSAVATAQNRKPVALFDATWDTVNRNDPTDLIDYSYDPDGDDIIAWEWTIQGIGTRTSRNVTGISWANPGTYSITLRVMDEHGLWSDPYTKNVSVLNLNPNRPPVAVISFNPNPGYEGEPLTAIGTGSYDPDAGDQIKYCFWRYRPPNGDWLEGPTQYRGDPDFLRFTVIPSEGQVGTWTFELSVVDSKDAVGRATATVYVDYGFKVRVIEVTPQPAERGRKVRVKAEAYRPSNNQKVPIDSMKVAIPTGNLPTGWTPHEAWMAYDAATGTWWYDYLVPEKVQTGRWPDDGWYTLKATGYRGNTAKEAYHDFEVRGHILRRVIIETEEW